MISPERDGNLRHGRAGEAGESSRRTEQPGERGQVVHPGLEQDAGAGLVEPRLHRGRVRERLAVPRSRQHDLADVTVLDVTPHPAERRREDDVRGTHEVSGRAAGQRHELARVRQRVGHRLLDEDVLAGGQARSSDVKVLLDVREHEHEVDVRGGDHVLVVRRDHRIRPPPPDPIRPRRAVEEPAVRFDVAGHDDVGLALSPEALDDGVVGVRDAAAADDPDPDLALRAGAGGCCVLRRRADGGRDAHRDSLLLVATEGRSDPSSAASASRNGRSRYAAWSGSRWWWTVPAG